MSYKHYGQTIERFIDFAAQMEEGEKKEALILMIANQMKKSFLIWNKDSVEDEKILADLADLSRGRILRYPKSFKLTDAAIVTEASSSTNSNSGGKNKKKKNKKNRQ